MKKACLVFDYTLIALVLIFSHNTEKVIYFLLLDRKRRKPSREDDGEFVGNRRDSISNTTTNSIMDPPRKRIDKVNGSACAYQFDRISEGSPITPRRHLYR